MPDFEPMLNRWQSAGVLDAESASRIRAWESTQEHADVPPISERQIENATVATNQARVANDHAEGIAWQGRVALILGGILLASGVALFVSAHWDQLGPGSRYLVVMAMVAIFHLGGAVVRGKYPATSTVLHAAGTVSTGAAIALVGQIFNIEEHWPAAVLMWAIAALAGWMLLRDQAQQTLALLLTPAWLICEWCYAAENHIGQDVYVGRFLFVWAIFYLTFFIGTNRRIVRGILFAVAAVACVTAVYLLLEGWHSWQGMQAYPRFQTRLWGWIDIAAIPILCSLFRMRVNTGSPTTGPGRWGVNTGSPTTGPGRWGVNTGSPTTGPGRWGVKVVPVLASIVFVIALPWCTRLRVEHYGSSTWTHTVPSLAAHALVAAFCIFLIWWGVVEASRGLVNLGIVGFGATVAWFYFSDIFDKMGRSLGLIGLGVLFLAGGWLLEKTRRSLLTHMVHTPALIEEAR